MLLVPIGSSRNSNFEADVLETHSHWAFLPMIFVISIFESIFEKFEKRLKKVDEKRRRGGKKLAF